MKEFSLLLLLLFCTSIVLAQDYDHYLNSAQSKFEQGEYESAQKLLNVYIQMTNNTNVELNTKISQCLSYQALARQAEISGNYASAKSYYEGIQRYNPKDPNVSKRIAELYNKQKTTSSQNFTPKIKTMEIGDYLKSYDRFYNSYYARYRIAYIDETGQHGWAIDVSDHDVSHSPSGHSWRTHSTDTDVPTKNELLVIYRNKSKLGLYNEYWSSSLAKKQVNGWGDWSDDWFYTVDFSTGKVNKQRCGKKGKACYNLKIIKF